MASRCFSLRQPNSLTARIKRAERQVLDRQQRVGLRTAALIQQIHHRITTPASLLLASGIGFLVGELTHRNPPKTQGNPNAAATVSATPLQTALHLITSAHAVYAAVLPLARMLKTDRQHDLPSQPSGQPINPNSVAGSQRDDSLSPTGQASLSVHDG